ncbi:MAG: hypothetical protein IT385_27285 [Deltaproteobacteria bacterium]|nr:hypothetical protein [Deltaproteobacteria bacterium]
MSAVDRSHDVPRRGLAALALVLAACGDGGETTRSIDEADGADGADVVRCDAVEGVGPLPPGALRAALGIPPEAARVLVFGQSAGTSSDQPRSDADTWALMEDVLSQALDALAVDPDQRYAIAEVAWLRRYWEAHPERREALCALDAEGRFAVVGGAVSSPDVLLPLGDNLLRDFRAGAGWLRSVGLARTSTAWLPDADGLGPTTPDLLGAAGIDAVALWRIDGAADPPGLPTTVADFADLPHAPGSSAELLATAGAIDFLWEGPGGAIVFVHWLAHGPALGDHLDFARIDRREPGRPVGVRADEAGILDNIQAMADLVLPLSPTDYGFVPVGGDLQLPKRDLARWVRTWNAERYPSTGTWAVAATFDDFTELAMTQADRLVVRTIDLAPHHMGGFATREQVKSDARLAAVALSQAEAVAAVADLDIDPGELDRLTWLAARTNHHDWITGTAARAGSDDARAEATRALRADAEALRGALLGELAPRAPTDAVVVVNTDHLRLSASFALPWDGPDGPVDLFGSDVWARYSGRVEAGVLRGEVGWLEPLAAAVFTVTPAAERPAMPVRCLKGEVEAPCDDADRVEVDQGPYSTLAFDRLSGGTLLTLDGTPDASNLLTAPALRLYDYLDEGGPATFAHELAQPVCGFTSRGEIVPAGPVAVDVRARSDHTDVTFSWEQGGMTWRRRYRVSDRQLAPLDVELTVGVAPGHTIVTRFDTRVGGDLWMAVPGGVVKRPVGKGVSPTFWPFERWAAKVERDVATFGIIAPSNPAVSFGDDGRIEVVLAREAGDACGDPEGGALRPVTLSMRVVSTYANDANGGVAATMDEVARDLFEPLLAVRGAGPGAGVEPGWITSISTTTSDAGHFDWRLRVARFARTPEGHVLTLERRVLAPRRMEVELTTRFPEGTVIERLDATEGMGEVIAGASPERFTVPMGETYLTLRFRPPTPSAPGR